jgi:catechol 2,3-dioxygenase-like lactoylglutathione lyase family enzyme
MRQMGGAWALVAWTMAVGAAGGEAQPAGGTIGEIETPFYFAVLVADVDRSVEWYSAQLGLELLDDTSADDGRWRIANLQNDQIFVEIIRDDRAQVAEDAMGLAKVGFRVSDVELVADRIERDTGERPRVLDFERHGVRILQVLDPDGNIIQLSSQLR